MIYRVFSLSAALLLLAAMSRTEAADCTNPPAPLVDWQRCSLDRRDLKGQNLSESHLADASFERADLSGANLIGVVATHGKFISTVMEKATLDSGNFAESDFTKADLRGASLRQTDLRRAHFFRADLRGADLSGARTQGADFLNADLSGATWTDGVRVCAEGSVGQCE